MRKRTESDEWLRSAVQVGVDEIERGEGIEFASIDELAEYIHAIGEEVSRGLAVERARESGAARTPRRRPA